jgi:hypothetical protein
VHKILMHGCCWPIISIVIVRTFQIEGEKMNITQKIWKKVFGFDRSNFSYCHDCVSWHWGVAFDCTCYIHCCLGFWQGISFYFLDSLNEPVGDDQKQKHWRLFDFYARGYLGFLGILSAVIWSFLVPTI